MGRLERDRDGEVSFLISFPSVDCVLGWVLGTQGEQNQLGFGAQLLVSVDRLSDSSSRNNHLLLDWSVCDIVGLA